MAWGRGETPGPRLSTSPPHPKNPPRSSPGRGARPPFPGTLAGVTAAAAADDEPDDIEDAEAREPPDRVYAPVLGVTLAWYVLPGLLFIFWSMLFGGGAASSGCGPGLTDRKSVV